MQRACQEADEKEARREREYKMLQDVSLTGPKKDTAAQLTSKFSKLSWLVIFEIVVWSWLIVVYEALFISLLGAKVGQKALWTAESQFGLCFSKLTELTLFSPHDNVSVIYCVLSCWENMTL